MFAFILGREFRLSLAEIRNLFQEGVFEHVNEQLAIVSSIEETKVRDLFPYMGGIIKVVKILDDVRDVTDFMTVSKQYLEQVERTNKVPFAIAGYGERIDMFKEGLRIKKFLKSCSDKSFRLVNKDPKNINSAVYKKERLAESETECNYISIAGHRYFGITIAYQDVDAYTERDMEKTRDMGVGMLPPKLAQIMINLWGKVEKSPAIYDPFCWLGTILIEAANMGYTEIFGSDIAREMIDVTKKSIADFTAKKNLKIESLIFEADASKIASRLPDRLDIRTTSIVTEWYLGDVLNARTVSDERIREQWRKLARIYDGFFRDLRTIGFLGDIVISFPFWELRGKNIFFEDITLIIDRYRFTRQPLLDDSILFHPTPRGSLLYKRPNQTVGREIFKLRFEG